jgi:hypothetical protein
MRLRGWISLGIFLLAAGSGICRLDAAAFHAIYVADTPIRQWALQRAWIWSIWGQ